MPGPVPPYNNPPIEPQNYKPKRFEISNITLGVNTVITSADDMDYVIGQLVRLLVPNTWGSTQLSEKTGMVISIPAANQVVINIDSSIGVDSFISSTISNTPQIVAVGDYNSGANNLSRTNNITFIDGSFINISPA